MTKSIGEAASELGIETHVLRHWEEVGALEVTRDGNNHRRYDAAAMEMARTVQKLRGVGLSLAEVIAAMTPKKSAAQAVVAAKIAELQRDILNRRQAVIFLEHTLECRHRYVEDCADCRDFVQLS